MKLKMKSKSIYFLMELMIVLFFFSLSAAICVYFITESYAHSEHGNNLRDAMLEGTNILEQIQAHHEVPESYSFIMDNQEYDAVVTSAQKEQYLTSGTIVIKRDDTILITLPFAFGEAR